MPVSLYLSVAQQQTFDLAMACSISRNLIIFDEPTSHLDSAQEKVYFNIIEQEFKDTAVIIITHHHEDQSFKGRRVILNNGHILNETLEKNENEHFMG